MNASDAVAHCPALPAGSDGILDATSPPLLPNHARDKNGVVKRYINVEFRAGASVDGESHLAPIHSHQCCRNAQIGISKTLAWSVLAGPSVEFDDAPARQLRRIRGDQPLLPKVSPRDPDAAEAPARSTERQQVRLRLCRMRDRSGWQDGQRRLRVLPDGSAATCAPPQASLVTPTSRTPPPRQPTPCPLSRRTDSRVAYMASRFAAQALGNRLRPSVAAYTTAASRYSASGHAYAHSWGCAANVTREQPQLLLDSGSSANVGDSIAAL